MADIFISYEKRDASVAHDLRDVLQRAGWSTFVDRDIAFGESWRQRIASELTQARAIVVLWSAAAAKSNWVCGEAQFGQAKGRAILMTLEVDVYIYPDFSQIQAGSLVGWTGDAQHAGLRKLIESLRSLLGARAKTSGSHLCTTSVTAELSPLPNHGADRAGLISITGNAEASESSLNLARAKPIYSQVAADVAEATRIYSETMAAAQKQQMDRWRILQEMQSLQIVPTMQDDILNKRKESGEAGEITEEHKSLEQDFSHLIRE